MKLHRWLLSADDMKDHLLASSAQMRAYRCSVCKSGPVWVPASSPKARINQVAKDAGIPSDCNEATVKEIMTR